MKTTVAFETKKFNAAMKKFMKKTNLSTEVVIKKIAFDLLASILTGLPTASRKIKGGMSAGFTIPDATSATGRHPVKTGRSRAGWYASVRGLSGNFNFESGINPKESKVHQGKPKGEFRDHTKHPWFKYVDLINAVDYEIYLEYGYSKQAPAGMVRVSMQKMTKELPKYLGQSFVDDWKKFDF